MVSVIQVIKAIRTVLILWQDSGISDTVIKVIRTVLILWQDSGISDTMIAMIKAMSTGLSLSLCVSQAI